MNFIDTHAHLDDDRFEDPKKIVENAHNEGVKYIIAPSTDVESCGRLKMISEENPGVYFTAGLHPHDAKDFSERIYMALKKRLEHEKAVAVGEVGLDFHYDFSPRDIQVHVLKRFLKLAKLSGKPLVLHCREAEQELYDLLKDYKGLPGGVVHCYTGSREWAEKFVELGFYIGFTGIITFKKSVELREVVKSLPSERILTETDSPYMTPVPYRGKTNEPARVRLVAEKIAVIKEKPIGEMAPLFLKNAGECFGLKFT